jgi:hypothetical protein
MYKKYVSVIFVSLLFAGFFVAIQPVAAVSSIQYAGCRASSYGISPFPSPSGWETAIKTMAGYWPGSIPSGVWIIGEYLFKGKDCGLQFPNPTPGVTYPNIVFEDVGINHEAYLTYFDTHGIKVFLQVEPGDADMGTLIDLVLGTFGSHPCVIGFGVDVEWLKDADGKVSDAEAQAWEAKVKSYNSNYRLFLKHWDQAYMPPTYRGNIIFVDDSQGFKNLSAMVNEFKAWANYFSTSTVFFQVGYARDKKWWSKLANPPKDIGDALDAAISNPMGVFWVDFTLTDVLPTG